MSRFVNSMLGVVDRAFYTTAKEKGITSQEAIRLNKMFTRLVDKTPGIIEDINWIFMLEWKETQLFFFL